MNLHQRIATLTVFVSLNLFAVSANAFGLGLTAELGGFTGFPDPDPTSLELQSPTGADGFSGADLALLLHVELLDKPFFKLHGIVRASGLAGAASTDLAATGLLGNCWVAQPSICRWWPPSWNSELVQDKARSMPVPMTQPPPIHPAWGQAYLGAGVSLKVPFMPLFEIRAGNRLISATGDWQSDYPDVLSLKELHVGGGFRF